MSTRPEEDARETIDAQLRAAGWDVTSANAKLEVSGGTPAIERQRNARPGNNTLRHRLAALPAVHPLDTFLAVAKRVFRADPKSVIEGLDQALIA